MGSADPATARTVAPAAAGFSLDDRYRLRAGRIYLTGIQALVRMLLDRARLDRDGGRDTGMYVTGYEGSPLAGYDLEIVRRRALLTGLGIVHQPGLNEELAATALVGTQLAGQVATPTTDGVTGIWYGKAPGLDRASDATVLPEPRLRFDGADFAMRITGVGGTGVVTIAQILATAAFLDGRDVRSLDQTGLAQKGGAVVSDIKFGSSTRALAAKVAAGECDLYLGCDPLVATDPVQLKATDPGRTVAIMSTAEVPTGRMVVDTTAAFPTGSAVREAMAGQVADARYVAADELAEALFGDEQYANILLVGAAFQAGALPLSVTSIERAIELNGVAVERNKQAFRQGRRAVLADTAAAGVTTAGGVPVPGRVDTAAVARIRELVRADGALGRIVDVRVPELVAYQDGRYAERYARFVEQVRHAEQERVPGSTALAAAVARQLYGLMAYKDEYEVARLILDPAVDADVRDRFGPGSRVRYRLHPPVLRALGMQRKISLGTWSRPGFRALYALRGLRGTRLDPFGRAEVRRVERELVDEYRSAVEVAVRALTPQNLTEVVALAELPDGVRGYEDVKLGNVAAFRDALAAALDGLVAGARV